MRRHDQCDVMTLRLGYRAPLAWPALARFMARRGAPCSERLDTDRYVRTVSLGDCRGWIAVTPDACRNRLRVELAPTLQPALTSLQARLRRLFDLDADPAVIATHLGADPRLAPLVRATPGLRIPGALNGFELALRTVLGQQISVKSATTIFTRFTVFFGEPVQTPVAGVDRLAPTAADIADARLQQIIDRGLTRKRAEAVQALARAVASGALVLEPGMHRDQTMATLISLPGIGPWTLQYIAMRALAAPDAFPAGDLALRKALSVNRPAQLEAVAQSWRPWRAYAAMHLWNHLAAGG